MSQVVDRPLSPAEALEYLKGLDAIQLKAIDELLSTGMPPWLPQVGPQMDAYFSQADILFYGGSAGGGKSDLLLGLALTAHEKSIVFRREAVQLVGLEERMASILGSRKGYNSQDALWRLPGDARVTRRTLEFGSVAKPGDWIKYQGRPHDLKGFDEITHFTEAQFRTLIGWMRTDNPHVRQRVVCAGNPPTDAEGEWVIRYWAPWLDPLHPNPAEPGELRWFISDAEGNDQEVSGPGEYEVKGEMVRAKSRTFIPSSVDDNLFLVTTGYKATLQSLPEPLRSMMLRGDFQAGRTDNPWQLIPTAWVEAAMARWQKRDAKGVMTALGYDPARGGLDRNAAARRHGQWFDELVTLPGAATPDGASACGFLAPLLRNGAPVCIDGIGIGTSVVDSAVQLGLNVVTVIGSEGSTGHDKTGNLRFRNKRAEMYWRLREALDPSADEPIALPPDKELKAELLAQRFKIVTMGAEAGIQIRDKDDLREVLGRSPDKSDAVAMTFIDEAGATGHHPLQQAQAFRRRSRIRDWRAA